MGKEVKFHPVANIFALMEGAKFDALCESIKKRGLRQAIWIYDGQIIDGRNRYRACEKVGVKPRYQEWDGDGSLVSFVADLNAQKRDLTSSQRALAAEEAIGFYEEEARERQLAGKKLEDTDLGQKTAQGRASEQAALDFYTNKQYIKDIKRIRREMPDQIEEIRAGRTNISKVMVMLKRDERYQKINESTSKPTSKGKKYSLIYADPPWRYESSTGNRAIENHYPTMAIEDIMALDVPAGDDCVLFLWTTTPRLLSWETKDVLEAWGFKPRSMAIWDKEIMGMGSYFRQQHEILIVAIKGDIPAPEPASRVSSMIRERRGKHSAKPIVVYEIIEAMYPGLDKIELFARNEREGWDSWGNQI